MNIVKENEKATERQKKAVCYHLWQAKYEDNVFYTNNLMTKDEASTILSSLMKGEYEIGIKQLEHFVSFHR